MENKTLSFWNGLPTWAKGVVAVGGLGIIAWTGYTIYKNAQRKKEEAEAKKQSDTAQSEVKVLEQQGKYATHSDSEFEAFSQDLVQAMNGCGTDEDMVYEVFKKMKNEVDIRKLVYIFGIRYYMPCSVSSPISYSKWLWNDKSFGGGISAWLGYDLTASEINKVNSILSTNGIDYSL
jgi:hypothetical protein